LLACYIHDRSLQICCIKEEASLTPFCFFQQKKDRGGKITALSVTFEEFQWRAQLSISINDQQLGSSHHSFAPNHHTILNFWAKVERPRLNF